MELEGIAYEILTSRLPGLRVEPGYTIQYEPTLMNVIIARMPVEWNVNK
ncbi:cytochrome P450 [Ferribacterium limneticum]|nr:cytochrome P450 [Ferribacterium limneticum]UCV17796.1 hypothetical protein KI610_13330 [Ferribacterium limneticum]